MSLKRKLSEAIEDAVDANPKPKKRIKLSTNEEKDLEEDNHLEPITSSPKPSKENKPPQPPSETVKKLPDSIKEIIKKMPFEDSFSNKLKVFEIRLLETSRFNIYCAVKEISDSLKNADYVVSVECVTEDNSNERIEKIVTISNESIEIIELEDKILLDVLSPSELIEYTFKGIDGSWFLAPISKMSLESYRKIKFKDWKSKIEKPDCKAALKRLLNNGLITKMYDPVAFPSPENEKSDWEVKDENGKTVQIPRPVHSLRVWNPTKRSYESVESHLDGAPLEKDAKKILGRYVG